MIELNEYIIQSEKRRSNKVNISLSGKLEGIIGNYFVFGEGTCDKDFHWLTVYYDSNIDTYTEAVELVPSNIVAYVSSDYRWGFVLSSHIQKFKENVSEYGISCIPISSFENEILQCSHTNLMPCEFSDIAWIDDDFMDNENIPFDYESFALIDEGVHYLNPKHFSVAQLIMIMESATR